MRKNWGKKRDEGLIKARRVDWEGKFIGKTHIEEIKRGGKGGNGRRRNQMDFETFRRIKDYCGVSVNFLRALFDGSASVDHLAVRYCGCPSTMSA